MVACFFFALHSSAIAVLSIDEEMNSEFTFFGLLEQENK